MRHKNSVGRWLWGLRDILNLVTDDRTYYVLLDEIQLVKGFEFVVSGLLHEPNINIYITGSNSKFLSTDIITEFRGRGEQIHVNPLSFAEYFSASGLDKYDAWNEYLTYGGMPLIISNRS